MHARILLGPLLILLVAGVLWLDLYCDGYTACALAMAVIAAGLLELFAMVRKAGGRPFALAGVVFAVALLPYYLWAETTWGSVDGAVFLALAAAPPAALAVLLTGLACRRPEELEPQLRNIATTFFGVFYVALPMTLLAAIRFLNEGWDLVVLVLVAVNVTDIAAYFVGKLMGRHRLAPRLSPNKTVEGAVGGLLCGVLAVGVLAYAMGIHTLIDAGAGVTILFGAVLGVTSQVGDLTESLLKRSTGTKDSSRLLPGFGGVLDVVDSFLVAAPAAYLLLALLAARADGP